MDKRNTIEMFSNLFSLLKSNVGFVFLAVLMLLCSVSSAVAVVNWNNFQVFNSPVMPYAMNGPGCSYFINGGISSPAVPAMPGDNCYGNNLFEKTSNDIGAVWVDMDDDYIAWQIMGPSIFGVNSANPAFCNASSPYENEMIIEFDADDNAATGCYGALPCYPGADYQIIFDTDGVSFNHFNDSNSSTKICTVVETCMAAEPAKDCNCFTEDESVTVETTTPQCENQYGLRFAVPRSAIASLVGMNFVINVFPPEQGPLEQLGDKNMALFIGGGPGDFMNMQQHPCFSYGNNQGLCENSSDNYACHYNSFGNMCEPDFGLQSCSDFCGACNNASGCTSGGKGKCMIVAAPPASFLPPGAVTFDNSGTASMCVDDFSKFDMGNAAGDCDDECKYCLSSTTCSNSAVPNPQGGSGAGCKWVTDSYFNKGTCQLVTFNEGTLSCGSSYLNRCFTQGDCTAAGGNWSAQSNVCYRHNESVEFMCFDGTDNDADSRVDCMDSDCKKEPFCGGDVNVLTGGFGTLNPFEAMKSMMFENMDLSPPINLAMDPPEATVPDEIDIVGLALKEMGTSLGVGIAVADFGTQSLLCGGTKTGRYYYFIDADANTSSGCDANISGTAYPGFDYKFEYEIKNNGTGSALEIRRGYRCLLSGAFALFPAKMAGSPPMGPPGSPLVACTNNAAIIAIEKSDMNNPKDNLRFMIATSDNLTTADKANDTILGGGNAGVYYTAGAMDFKPKDCSANPMSCGTAFGILGGGKFMPFEDCFPSSGDEDADGFANCADSDCMMAPWCEGSFDFSSDKTAPTVYSATAETFNDFVFLQWTTNEPTNSTVKFYANCSTGTATNTFYELGDPTFVFDDYKPWHGLDIEDGDTDSLGAPRAIAANTAYYYKLTVCDKAGNCGYSTCLNFTTKAAANPVKYRFDFGPSLDSFVNDTKIRLWNGTAYENLTAGEAANKSNYLKDGKIKFDNPANNWEIELVGVDLAKALTFNVTGAFNITNSSGDMFVGLDNSKWNDMAQNLGVDSVLLKIPDNGNRLIKCNENNLSDCSDVTAKAVLNESGAGYTIWEIPVSLGFSVYGTNQTGGGAGTVSLSSDRNTYSVYTAGVAYYNLTNSNVSLANNTYNLTINNTAVPGTVFDMYYYNATGDWQSIGANNTNLLFFNFTQGTHQFRVNISMVDPLGWNWSMRFRLDNLSTNVLDMSDYAYLDAINLTVPANLASVGGTTNFSFKLYAGGMTTQTCTLYINGTGYGSVSATNGTLGGVIPSSTVSDGSHSWRIGCSASGEVGYSDVRYFVMDSSAPVVSGATVSNTGILSSSTSVLLNLTVNDASVVSSVTVGNSSKVVMTNSTATMYNVTTTPALLGCPQGSCVIRFNATDAWGQSNLTATLTLRVDDSPPSVTVTYLNASIGSRNVTNSTAVQINVSAPDVGVAGTVNVTVSNYSLVLMSSVGNDVWQVTTTPAALGCGEGVCTLKFNATDNISLSNSTVSASFVVDNVKPAVSGAALNVSQVKIASPVQVNVTVTDSSAVTSVYVNSTQMSVLSGSTYSVATTPAALGCGANSVCTLGFSATDNPGNVNSSLTATVIVDDVAPFVSFVYKNTSLMKSGQGVLLNVSLTETNTVASVRANGVSMSSFGGGVYSVATTGTALGCASSGTCAITFVANDTAGNSGTNSTTVSIDNDNPAVTDASVTNATKAKAASTVNIRVNVTDSNLLNVSVNGNAMFGSSGNYFIANLSGTVLGCSTHGTCTLTFVAQDTLGNINNSVTAAYLVDETGPGNTTAFSASVSFDSATVSATMNESSKCTVIYGSNSSNLTSSANSSSFSSTLSVSLSGLSASTVYYYNVTRCWDEVDNANTFNFGTFNFTTTAQPSTSGGGGGGGSSSPAVTYDLGSVEEVESTDATLGKNDKVTLKKGGELHTILVVSVGYDSVNLRVDSVAQFATLLVGETRLFDLDRDGKNDISIKLDSIFGSKAKLLIRSLIAGETVPIKVVAPAASKPEVTSVTPAPAVETPAVSEVAAPAPETAPVVQPDVAPAQMPAVDSGSQKGSYVWWIIGLVVVLGLIAGIVYYYLTRDNLADHEIKVDLKPRQDEKHVKVKLRK